MSTVHDNGRLTFDILHSRTYLSSLHGPDYTVIRYLKALFTKIQTSGYSGLGIVLLMQSGHSRSELYPAVEERRIHTALVVRTAGFILYEERSPLLSRFPHYFNHACRIVLGNNNCRTAFDYACLMHSYLLHCIPKQCGMVQRNRSYHRKKRRRDNVGAVQQTANTCLQYDYIAVFPFVP